MFHHLCRELLTLRQDWDLLHCSQTLFDAGKVPCTSFGALLPCILFATGISAGSDRGGGSTGWKAMNNGRGFSWIPAIGHFRGGCPPATWRGVWRRPSGHQNCVGKSLPGGADAGRRPQFGTSQLAASDADWERRILAAAEFSETLSGTSVPLSTS